MQSVVARSSTPLVLAVVGHSSSSGHDLGGGNAGLKGPLKDWKRSYRIQREHWGMGSGNEGLGFVARGKVAICGFMFGKEQSDADFLLKV